MKADIGLVGLGVMGQNLALNMVDHGFSVAVHDPWPQAVQRFFDGPGKGCAGVSDAGTLKELAGALKRPRRVMLMVKAGAPVDALIDQLFTVLEPGDIIIDGGNSHFQDTRRRSGAAQHQGLRYLGVGVSGGEEGARFGASMMVGGHPEAWEAAAPVLTAIAAAGDDGRACCGYMGPDGAGHFVKMVHNGIEYADMQLIAEAYFLMRELLGMTPREMKAVLAEWDRGELNSYLVGITAEILGKTDRETGRPMVDVIVDRAGQKGTGQWTVQEALNLGVAVPTIAEAVFARSVSARKDERMAASGQLGGRPAGMAGDDRGLIEEIRSALYASKVCAYAQGFALLREASAAYGWGLRFGEIASVWRGGCIIRAQFLNRIQEAYDREPDLPSMLMDPYFAVVTSRALPGWRKVVCLAAERGVPAPGFSSALGYFDSCRRAELPANLIQAQRDFFGAHTYERVDRPGTFHTDWKTPGEDAESVPVK